MEQTFSELVTRLAEVYDLTSAALLLDWDMETYMPPGGAEARAQQLATLRRLSHEKLTSERMGRLLEELEPFEADHPYESFEASLIRIARREYKRNCRVPADFIRRQAETGSLSYEAWAQARPASDWNAVRPWLERILDLSLEYASFFPEHAHVVDPLIDMHDPGMTAAELTEIFRALRGELIPLVQAITSQPAADDSCLHQYFPAADQLAFGLELVKRMGYDITRGRQDLTAHPFMTLFSIDDVRITTRVDEHYLGQALFSTIHEAGHAMYGQGHDRSLKRTLLAEGASAGAHESQSRLWENLVGRSRGFWQYAYPELQARFPAQLGNVSLDTFYRAINRVQRSLTRVEADEVTYNLHVMLRFDLEVQLLEGKLAVSDLPEAWNARMEQDLGLTPPDYGSGVMQDVHWYSGQIGGLFQGYTLGNIMSAQFYESALQAHPEIPGEIASGRFDTLRGWLTDNISRPGSKFTGPELIRRVTGGPIRIEPYVRYLRNKYGELYTL